MNKLKKMLEEKTLISHVSEIFTFENIVDAYLKLEI